MEIKGDLVILTAIVVGFILLMFFGVSDNERYSDMVAARCPECGVIGYYEDVPAAEEMLSNHVIEMHPGEYDFSNLSFHVTDDGIEMDIPR